MSVNTNEFLDAAAVLMYDRVRIERSGIGALIPVVACFIGGLMYGPEELAVSFVVGYLLLYGLTRGRISTIEEIIENLTVRQREQLVQHIVASVDVFQVPDLAVRLPFLLEIVSVRKAFIRAAIKFVRNKHV